MNNETQSAASCAKCKFWNSHGNDLSGNCRFNPPAVLSSSTPGSWPDTVWPVTGSLDWCGQGLLSVAAPNHARDLAEALSDLLGCDNRENRADARRVLDSAIAEGLLS